MSENIVFLNGNYVKAKDAMISVYDRGFLFADAIYEVITIHKGQSFMQQQHLERMDKSLNEVDIKIDLSQDEINKIIKKLITLNDPKHELNLSIYIQISRGNDNNQRTHAQPENIAPTILISCQQVIAKKDDDIKSGISVISHKDERRLKCHIKATGLMPNIQILQKAKKSGYADAILIRDGKAIESTSSNLFIVKTGKLITPPISENILHGITRQSIIDIAKENNIPTIQQDISEQELIAADEIFITGSLKGIWPIVKLDQNKIGDGKIGALTERLLYLYQDYFRENLK